MRRLRILTLVCMVISTGFLVVSTIYQKSVEDQTIPVIQCPEAPLTIPMEGGGDEALLKDVTAWDEKDGDLTDRILLQGVDKRAGASTATVTTSPGIQAVITTMSSRAIPSARYW